jgi:4-hydroxythreonine-4-phosphate dehydrogenase
MGASTHRPLVGTVIGDPGGIGPEVVAKAWCSGAVHELSRPVLIGSRAAMEHAVRISGLYAEVRTVVSVGELSDSPEVIEILDSGALDPTDITLGKDNATCGRASGVWLDEADRLAREGVLAATVMGPISTGAMKMAGVLDKVVKVTPGESYLFLVSGPLRVSHVTDHMSLRQVCDLLSETLVARSLVTLDERLRAWGIKSPRIGVAGLNPHAVGEEEERAIAPGVRRAVSLGVNAEGPVSPQAIFRQCI